MVDENDLALVKAAAAATGRPESELFREAFHLVAVRARRWEADWDVPRLDFGRPITQAEIDDTVRQAMSDKK